MLVHGLMTSDLNVPLVAYKKNKKTQAKKSSDTTKIGSSRIEIENPKC
jgi:hypothetical protein